VSSMTQASIGSRSCSTSTMYLADSSRTRPSSQLPSDRNLQSRWCARAHSTGSWNARAAIGSTLLRSPSPRIPAPYVAKDLRCRMSGSTRPIRPRKKSSASACIWVLSMDMHARLLKPHRPGQVVCSLFSAVVIGMDLPEQKYSSEFGTRP
jgi:hypothetical protein